MRSRGGKSTPSHATVAKNRTAIVELEVVATTRIRELDSPKEKMGADTEAARNAAHGFSETVVHETSEMAVEECHELAVEECHELAADSDYPKIRLGLHGKDVRQI